MASPLSAVAPWPPAAAPVQHPTQTETYGFLAAGTTYVLFALYLLWAFLPDFALEAIGISWYPNREWAILLPAWTMVLVLFTYASYASLMLYNTPDLTSTAWLDNDGDPAAAKGALWGGQRGSSEETGDGRVT